MKSIRIPAITSMAIILFFSCNKPGDPLTPINKKLAAFTVTVSNRLSATAALNWTASVNTNNADTVKYKVYVNNNQLAQGLTATSYNLTGLAANSTYTGLVMAYTNSGDTASASFTVGVAPASPYSYVTGFYKVTETSKIISTGATVNYTFAAQATLINDSVIQFTQSRRVPSTWWTADFPTQIYPAQGDTLIGGGITPRGRIVNTTTIRMSYLFGTSVVYDVKQLWQKLANPADTALIVYTYPNFTGMITTVAGNSYSGAASGITGDGGPATAAGLVSPNDVVVDNAGNIYISNGGATVGFSVRKINTSGIISRYAGNNTVGFSGDGGQATAAQLGGPYALAIDNAGNLFISDGGNYVIRKVATNGIITTIAGIPNGFGYTGDGGPATAAKIGAVFGMAFDAAGNLYLADASFHVIRKIATNGIITTIAGNGTNGFSGDGGAATSAQFNQPWDVYVDGGNNLYVADYNNHAVRKITAAGIISTVAGIGGSLNAGFSGDGGAATAAKLNHPASVTLDAAGNIYISDYSNNRIRKVSTTGTITTIAGSGQSALQGDGPDFYGGDYGAATAAAVSSPMGITWNNNNLYITTSTHRVRRVKF